MILKKMCDKCCDEDHPKAMVKITKSLNKGIIT